MDSFTEKDEDDDENVLQKPMQVYNSEAENIALPELHLNDNVSANHSLLSCPICSVSSRGAN